MVILEVRRVCLNIHRYDWWANLCLHKRMAKNSITYLFNPERYRFKLQILQFGIYINRFCIVNVIVNTFHSHSGLLSNLMKNQNTT